MKGFLFRTTQIMIKAMITSKMPVPSDAKPKMPDVLIKSIIFISFTTSAFRLRRASVASLQRFVGHV